MQEKNIRHTEQQLLKLEELARSVIKREDGLENSHWTTINTYGSELAPVANSIINKDKYCGDKTRQELFDRAFDICVEKSQKSKSNQDGAYEKSKNELDLK